MITFMKNDEIESRLDKCFSIVLYVWNLNSIFSRTLLHIHLKVVHKLNESLWFNYAAFIEKILIIQFQ